MGPAAVMKQRFVSVVRNIIAYSKSAFNDGFPGSKRVCGGYHRVSRFHEPYYIDLN